MTVRIVIADDHPLTRGGLAEWIRQIDWLELCGEAEDGERALDIVRAERPDIALLDIKMPGMSGIAVASQIRRERLSTRAVMLTSFDAKSYVAAALAAGAKGFVIKTAAVRELEEAVRAVMSGGFYLSPKVQDVARGASNVPPELTAREREVLLQTARGRSIKETAVALCITERTVQAHLSAIYTKYCCGSKGEALLTALRLGVITVDEMLEEES